MVHFILSLTDKEYEHLKHAAEVLGVDTETFIRVSALEESDYHAHRHADSEDEND